MNFSLARAMVFADFAITPLTQPEKVRLYATREVAQVYQIVRDGKRCHVNSHDLEREFKPGYVCSWNGRRYTIGNLSAEKVTLLTDGQPLDVNKDEFRCSVRFNAARNTWAVARISGFNEARGHGYETLNIQYGNAASLEYSRVTFGNVSFAECRKYRGSTGMGSAIDSRPLHWCFQFVAKPGFGGQQLKAVSLLLGCFQLVPTEGVEAAERCSLAFACVRNCLRKRRLRSQKQNAKIASERTKAKENEKVLSSIVIKNIGFLRGGSFSESLEPSCSRRRWRAPPSGEPGVGDSLRFS